MISRTECLFQCSQMFSSSCTHTMFCCSSAVTLLAWPSHACARFAQFTGCCPPAHCGHAWVLANLLWFSHPSGKSQVTQEKKLQSHVMGQALRAGFCSIMARKALLACFQNPHNQRVQWVILVLRALLLEVLVATLQGHKVLCAPEQYKRCFPLPFPRALFRGMAATQAHRKVVEVLQWRKGSEAWLWL